MRHCIETNVTYETNHNIAAVRKVVLQRVEDSQVSNVFFNFVPVGFKILVEVHGNGALLRDVAYALDVAGMLD